MLIDKAEIERVKRANELVAFIRSRGVALTQRGKQLVGLCPFHDDHEPSLVVDPKKQLWNRRAIFLRRRMTQSQLIVLYDYRGDLVDVAAVKTFFNWLVRTQQLAHNPAALVQPPRQPQTLPRDVLTQDEARRLLEATPTNKPLDIRDRAILEVFYATGIRRAELLSLTNLYHHVRELASGARQPQRG